MRNILSALQRRRPGDTPSGATLPSLPDSAEGSASLALTTAAPATLAESTPAPGPSVIDVARAYEDGAEAGPDLRAALEREIAERRRRTGALHGPRSPHLSQLIVRRAGLPDWWTAGGNLLLTAPDAGIPELRPGLFAAPPQRGVVAMGRGSQTNHFNLAGEDPLIVFGDNVGAGNGGMSAIGLSTILIGDRTTATMWARIDCRNDGIVLVGPDGMWAHGVVFMTDDTHAIRDMHTGQRLNGFGGRIIIGEHVWLGEQVRVMAGTVIGDHSVVGAESIVKTTTLPPNTVSVGRPARPVRSGVTWTREDLP